MANPQQDNGPLWLVLEYVVLPLLTLCGSVLALLWKTVPSRAEVQQMVDAKLDEYHIADLANDQTLLAPLIVEQQNLRAEVMRMHGENRDALSHTRDEMQKGFGAMNEKLDRIWENLASRMRGH